MTDHPNSSDAKQIWNFAQITLYSSLVFVGLWVLLSIAVISAHFLWTVINLFLIAFLHTLFKQPNKIWRWGILLPAAISIYVVYYAFVSNTNSGLLLLLTLTPWGLMGVVLTGKNISTWLKSLLLYLEKNKDQDRFPKVSENHIAQNRATGTGEEKTNGSACVKDEQPKTSEQPAKEAIEAKQTERVRESTEPYSQANQSNGKDTPHTETSITSGKPQPDKKPKPSGKPKATSAPQAEVVSNLEPSFAQKDNDARTDEPASKVPVIEQTAKDTLPQKEIHRDTSNISRNPNIQTCLKCLHSFPVDEWKDNKCPNCKTIYGETAPV